MADVDLPTCTDAPDRPPFAILTTPTVDPTASVIPVTATFSSAVTGVTAADFNGGVAFPVEAGVSYAVTGSGTEWVLTVTLDSAARADKSMTFNMVAESGAISPKNLASTYPLTVS